MDIALITGSAGLVGSESVRFLAQKNFKIVGIDNDMRSYFFGKSASTEWNRKKLEEEIKDYSHNNLDIRYIDAVMSLFKKYNSDIKLIVHTAAQPSHDWPAKNDVFIDFEINARGTLNLLEATRRFCPKAVFIFMSTNKVYGDTANGLPLIEHETRYELGSSHDYYQHGIDESMSIDKSKHSLFGVSKTSADLLVQEYGRYFDMKTVSFRAGCITGPMHSGAKLHGFLAYLIHCAIAGEHYQIFGYKGKQVRDNIHSYDLVNMFWHFYQNPKIGEVYNTGGSRHSNCSVLEAIFLAEEITGKRINYSIEEENRVGDHKWWISDVRKFRSHYPRWEFKYDLRSIIQQINESLVHRLSHSRFESGER